jgi:outer membrane protein assembly factor BamB
VRWWPVWVILAVGIAAFGVVQVWPDWSHQQQNIARAQIIVYGMLLVIVWVLLLSRLRWTIRLACFGVILAAIVLVCVLFRIRGVSGDLLPVLSWRFRGSPRSDWAAIPRPTTPSAPVVGPSEEYPQFLGPARNGVIAAASFSTNWAARPPKSLWRQNVGAAWSGFAISGHRAVTQEQRGEDESVICYDLASGATLWVHADAAHYHTTIAGEGPRATPTTHASRVYTMGATGLLNCLDLATGHVLWTKNIPTENGGEVGEWGVSCSPLILGDNVLVTTGAKHGKSLAAYRADDGTLVWQSGDDRASYSSPISETLLGVRQILIFNSGNVTGHDPQSGAVLWHHPWPTGHPHIATPLVLSEKEVLVSSGYGVGSELLQLSRDSEGKWSAQRRWKSNRLKSKFANLIHRDACIYGLDDGILVCLDAQTGELKWKEGRYGHGQMLLTGNLLLIMAENGEIVLLDPQPDRRRELTRFQALAGKTWNPPALAGQYLLVRNDQEAACYWLAKDDGK